MALTHRELTTSTIGAWLSDGGARGAGTLLARRTATTTLFYFRYVDGSGKRDTLPIGDLASMTLAQARQRALELSARYRAGERDIRSILDHEQAQNRRQRQQASEDETERTFGHLLEAYCDALEAAGKVSARDVRATLRLHVSRPWPAITALPVAQVTLEDLLEIVGRIVQLGHRRTAARVRSYIQSAFSAAIRARQDPSATPALRSLRVTTNPARDLLTVEGAANARDRALSLPELRAYWRRLETIEGGYGHALRFHLLTGGQRIEQLRRLTTADVDTEARTMRMLDPKGRRSKARVHLLPLTDAAIELIEHMAPERLGDYIWTVTAGTTSVDPSALSKRLAGVVEAMLEAGELPGGRFTLGDLRRTVETRLAAAGVSMEVRGQLQSHGLGGVQTRHYDRHDYVAEKLAALETLGRILVQEASTVTVLRARSA
ncbi:integrase family protein [Stenotrophomonas maltophilia]|nr:integrase family protein [Stenotrophomonas maltophilia]